MDGFLQQLRRHWAERFGSGPRHLVVAVSGGLDSMVLLHSLARLRRKFPWQLTVAHCHHGLRGTDADGDADWVRAQSAALGLPCIVEEVSVRAAAEASRESLEMAARRLRSRWGRPIQWKWSWPIMRKIRPNSSYCGCSAGPDRRGWPA